MRAHVVLPEELIAEVDKVAGKRRRSQFIEEAIRLRLEAANQYRALQEFKKLHPPGPPPPWGSTPEKTTAWVRALRDNDQEKLRELGWPGEPDD